MKPLYLNSQSHLVVQLDSPALRVIKPDESDRLFPLARVSRVIVSGHVEWSMEALFACAEQGVAIFWLEQTGEIKCRLLGAVQAMPVLSLPDLFSQHDALPSYENWLLAIRRIALKSCLARLNVSHHLCNLQALEAFLDTFITVELRHKLVSLIECQLNEKLMLMGIDSAHPVLRNPQFNLLDDLSHLLSIDYYPDLINHRKTFSACNALSSLIQLIEQRSERLDRLLVTVLAKLNRHLKPVN